VTDGGAQLDGAALEPVGSPLGGPPPLRMGEEPREGDPSRSPSTGWPWWTAFLALAGGIVLATVGGLVVDLPALAFGVKLTTEHTPPGISIIDTVVQDIAFVAVAVYCARLGGRAVRSWQFGLRRPGAGWPWAGTMVILLIVLFLILSVIWSEVFSPEKEKLLETLGSNEGAALLVSSAALTCVVAPICEEFLFRGYMFTALRNRVGTLPGALITGLVFGGVHAGSAPVLDLAPLAALGFGLCLLYRYTGSLYPSMIAHSINNSLAFSSLENWSWQLPVLLVGSLLTIGAVVLVCKRVGLISSSPPLARLAS
jgi:membrane protease YdiL (CAAX protease family)